MSSLPVDWKIVTIQDCCEILDSLRVPVNSDERSSRVGGVPYYGANGIQGYIDDFIFDEDLVLLAEDGGNFEQYESRPISYIIRGKSWVNNHAHVLRAKKNTSTEFIHYSLVHKNILGFINGGTRSKLNQSDLRIIPIAFPPVIEQEKIVKILSSIDKVILLTGTEIEKLQNLKKGMIQDLFTKGIGHTKFKDSPIGKIPESWGVLKLEDLARRIGDGLHSTPEYVDRSDYYFVNGNNIKNGILEIGTGAKCVSREEYIKHKKELCENTLLMSINGTIGNLAYYRGEQVVLGKSAAYISINDKNYLDYIFYYLDTDFVRNYFELELTGSTIKNLSLKAIRSTPIAIPSMGEILKIVDSLRGVDQVLNLKTLKLERYRNVKKGLMQDLLTGKLRVRV